MYLLFEYHKLYVATGYDHCWSCVSIHIASLGFLTCVLVSKAGSSLAFPLAILAMGCHGPTGTLLGQGPDTVFVW